MVLFPRFSVPLVRLAAAMEKEKEKDDKGENNDDGDETRQRNQNTHNSLLVMSFIFSNRFFPYYTLFFRGGARKNALIRRPLNEGGLILGQFNGKKDRSSHLSFSLPLSAQSQGTDEDAAFRAVVLP